MSSDNTLARVEKNLLAETELTTALIRRQLAAVMTGLDFADAYLERTARESWSLEDGIVKTGDYSCAGGMGLRAVRGETTAYLSSETLDKRALALLADAADTARIHGGGTHMRSQAEKTPPTEGLFTTVPPPTETAAAQKIAFLKEADTIVRAADTGVENVLASLVTAQQTVLIIRPDGQVAVDERPMTRFSLQVVIADGGRRETGGAGGGGRFSGAVLTGEWLRAQCDKAIDSARAKLDAGDAPVGKMPVVLGPGWAGVLLHEAVGHGLESDFNRKKQSAFSGRIGEQVAADGVTVIDAGNIGGRRGSLTCDDEGTPTGETVLIENGVLRAYMQDTLNARLTGTASTGNGRRQSYAYPPMPRMTNTFMAAGKYSSAEIIASVRRGLYAADFNGGEVDITTGNFVFVVERAQLIENGKLGQVVKGATIIGNGPKVMPLVSMVGDDFALDPGIGTCGKGGQWVPVGVGQPTIKIDAITVGGKKSNNI